MAKPTNTTKSNPKSKPMLKVDEIDNMDDTLDPVWTEETEPGAPVPKQFSDSLKRIGDLAKDWEEVPRPRKEKPATTAPTAAATPAPAATPPAQVTTFNRPGAVTVPKWAAGLTVGLLLVCSAVLVWLGMQAVALQKIVAEQNHAVLELSTNMKQLSDALATWHQEAQAEAQAAAEAAAAAAKSH